MRRVATAPVDVQAEVLRTGRPMQAIDARRRVSRTRLDATSPTRRSASRNALGYNAFNAADTAVSCRIRRFRPHVHRAVRRRRQRLHFRRSTTALGMPESERSGHWSTTNQ
ncbi:hypothetical protein [Mycobacterium intracellulare]|uniref:hypothetical protein n=1 Tax=Mycobacterium intracellulare TaxID=1767 RepID=UPI003075F68F